MEDVRCRPAAAEDFRFLATMLGEAEGDHGHGFVAEDVPELAIAVIASRRREGIGRQLLVALIEDSEAAGYPALSLSVNHANPARGLYESLGFQPVGTPRESSLTMVRHTPRG